MEKFILKTNSYYPLISSEKTSDTPNNLILFRNEIELETI